MRLRSLATAAGLVAVPAAITGWASPASAGTNVACDAPSDARIVEKANMVLEDSQGHVVDASNVAGTVAMNYSPACHNLSAVMVLNQPVPSGAIARAFVSDTEGYPATMCQAEVGTRGCATGWLDDHHIARAVFAQKFTPPGTYEWYGSTIFY